MSEIFSHKSWVSVMGFQPERSTIHAVDLPTPEPLDHRVLDVRL